MFKTILVPLDGSAIAECVLPHALSLSTALEAHTTLFHVLERPHNTGHLHPVDPLRRALTKQAAEEYLERLAFRMKEEGVEVEICLQEGFAAEAILQHAHLSGADLILVSTHGASGLSGWNVSSVVQKIVSRANTSLLLVRAYRLAEDEMQRFHYRRIFVGLDASARAELVLPVAIRLAQYQHASLTLGIVVEKPDLLSRLPLSVEDVKMLKHFAERNRQVATHYLARLRAQVASTGIEVHTRLETSTNMLSALHKMVQEENADLVALVAHGRSADGRWPYGSVTASFLASGSTSLLIVQDLTATDVQQSMVEQAIMHSPGH